MPNVLRLAVVAFAVTAASTTAVGIPAAHATTASVPATLHDPTWAGYYSVTAKNTPPLWASVDFTVPRVSCSKSHGSAPYAGSMWVGIGGIVNKGIDPGGQSLLEQTGIDVICANNKSTTKPSYNAFWEVFPNLTTKGYKGSKVKAGDHIMAQVTSPAASESPSSGEWDFMIIDYTSDHTWTASYRIPHSKLPKDNYTGSTAEVTTEWTQGTVNGKRVGFVDLGQVNYTYADYGTADSSLLSILHNEIEMWTGKHKMVYPTTLHASPGSDAGNDAFSTKYTSDWTKAF
jgi:hypothetical protein